MTLLEIKRALRSGQYAWPGGYPLYFLTGDGEPLSFKAARENWREIVSAHLSNDIRGDWFIAAVDINWEDTTLECSHSNAPIESAYGEE